MNDQPLPPAIRKLVSDYAQQGPQRAAERWGRAMAMAAYADRTIAKGDALDVGCGSGGGLGVLAKHFHRVIGYDVLPESLALARQYVQVERLANVTLVQGDAMVLPFPDGSFDYIQGIDVLHHFSDPIRALRELRRVLRWDGVLAMDSANRFTPLAPEPHIKLWGVGWLPRAWQAPYVRWRRGVAYETFGAHLLSLSQLQRMLMGVFGEGKVALYSPFLWKRQPARGAGLIHAMRRHALPLLHTAHHLFLMGVPNHEFLAVHSGRLEPIHE